MQIIGEYQIPIYYYNGAVLNDFQSNEPLSLRCVTLEGNESPMWSTDNNLLANFLSSQQNITMQINMINITLEVLNSREQVLQFSGSPFLFDAQLSGNYSCVSQVSGQSANLTLTPSKLYVLHCDCLTLSYICMLIPFTVYGKKEPVNMEWIKPVTFSGWKLGASIQITE